MSTKVQSRRPKSGRRKMPVAAIVILITITLLILVAVFGVYYLLNLYKPTPAPVDPSKVPEGLLTGDITTDEHGNFNPDDVRRKDFYTFLVLGKDVSGYNTDVFMLISFDVGNHAISVMQIPRDTYVETDGSQYKINALYAHMRSKARSSSTAKLSETELLHAGMKGVAGVLQDNLNIFIDYYVIMDLQGFRNIVDSIGGVYMYVPQDMVYSDPEQNLYINLKQGYQTLNGEEAEQFVRYRKGYAMQDLTRIEAQKLFMSALVNQVKAKLSVTTVANIAQQAWEYVDTSLSAADLVYFAKEFFAVDNANIAMLTCPGEATYVGRASYYVVHRAELLYMINQYYNVYKADISDDAFDANRAFVNESYDDVLKIYSAAFEGIEDYSHTVDDIGENGIPLY